MIAVDGKTARGSRDRANGGKPLHRVSAWACENRLVLAQEATDEKPNEITAIPKLLALLELKGCIVTLDAKGCQRAIAGQIKPQQGGYVMGLKGNQSNLHEAVEDYFTTARQHAFKAAPHTYAEEADKDHGRLEIRRYWVTEDLSTLPNVGTWTGLHSIGMAERECTQGGQTTVEQRFFITPIPADAKLFAKAVRQHWSVENTLHWRLDVTLSEDQSRIRKGNGPAMVTPIRHLCTNLFEREAPNSACPKSRTRPHGMMATAPRYCLLDYLCAVALEREYVAASVPRFMDSPAEQEIRRAYHAVLNGKSVDLDGLATKRVGQHFFPLRPLLLAHEHGGETENSRPVG